MNTIISINNLSYSYNKRKIFSNFNLEIEEGSWITISGPNASGKTTLVKIISGLIKTNSVHYKLKEIKKEISVLFENEEENFMSETVKDELMLSLNPKNLTQKEIVEKFEDITDLLNITDLLDKNLRSLSSNELKRVLIAASLLYNPKILILDNFLSNFSTKEKEDILKVIRRYKKDNNITIINFTTNLEESFATNRLIILNKGKVLLDGKPLEVMEKDTLLNRIGLELPFIIDLSSKLKLYGLIDDLYVDIDKLVFDIWK